MQIIVNNNALITINATLVIQVLSFLVFLFIINRIMIRPLRQTIQSRKQLIETIKAGTHKVQVELDALGQKLEAREIAVKQEAFKISESLSTEGDAEATRIVENAQKEIDCLKDKAEMSLKTQIQSVHQYLQKEAENLTDIIMEKVLNRRLTS
jgi:F-type H+-transporting ATPase subunit b